MANKAFSEQQKEQANLQKVITGKCRASCANLSEPKSINGGKAKYSCSVIIPKSDTVTINRIKTAIQAAYDEGQSKLKGSVKSVPPLATLKQQLRDGDLERPDDEAYADSYFVNATSDSKPGLVGTELGADGKPLPLTDTSEVYSGIYARFSLNFYAFSVNGNRSFACGLNGIHKLSNGTPLGGKSRAEDDFADGYEYED